MNVLDSFKLDGKVAIVTGGYGHLGRAFVEALHEAQAKVYVAARNRDRFLDVFKDTENVEFVYLDILDTNSIKEAFSVVYNENGKIDVLVNNAVSLDFGSAFMDDETWNRGINGVLNSVFRCIREVVPYMKKGSSIVNISSMYGIVSPDFRIYNGFEQFMSPPHYGVAKSGVIQMTRYYAVKLAERGIRVNCISPGPFPSQSIQKFEGFVENLKDKVPLGRIGKPEDLKGALVLLASDASSFITGHNLVVDGGWTIW